MSKIDPVVLHVKSIIDKRKEEKVPEYDIVVISGSFNPMHTMHIQMLVEAKKCLEAKGKKCIAGFLAPSSDSYLKFKLGTNAMPLTQRNNIAKLAVKDSGEEWIGVCDWGIANSKQVVKNINLVLTNYFKKSALFRVWNVGGADFVQKGYFSKIKEEYFICCNRAGYDLVKLDKINTDKFIIINSDKLIDISSTSIRKCYSSKDKKDWETPLKNNWIGPLVHNYILEHYESDLFFKR